MNTPAHLRYTPSHEWIESAGDGTARIGITDHAQNELTDIVFVDPTAAGNTVAAGEVVAVVESVKAASDIYAPLDCEIVETNPALADQPGLINTDPYGAGWITRVRLADPAVLDTLLTADQYAARL